MLNRDTFTIKCFYLDLQQWLNYECVVLRIGWQPTIFNFYMKRKAANYLFFVYKEESC